VAGVASEDVRRRHMASCYRLWKAGKTIEGVAEDGAIPVRAVDADAIRPGDIVVVGNGKKRWGDHICLVERVQGGLVYTIEGNARGVGPDGDTFEGVVKRTRPPQKSRARCPVSGLRQAYEVMWAYRVGGEG